MREAIDACVTSFRRSRRSGAVRWVFPRPALHSADLARTQLTAPAASSRQVGIAELSIIRYTYYVQMYNSSIITLYIVHAIIAVIIKLSLGDCSASVMASGSGPKRGPVETSSLRVGTRRAPRWLDLLHLFQTISAIRGRSLDPPSPCGPRRRPRSDPAHCPGRLRFPG